MDGLLGSPVIPTACFIDSVTVMMVCRYLVRAQLRARRGG
jgi:hypothetical protein